MISLHGIIREAEENYTSGTARIGEYVDWSIKETIDRIFAYIHSRHTTGATDSLGREKPFFNIVIAAINIWYRATDLDRKDMIVLPSKSSDVVAAFVATVLLQDWMKKAHFGVFLNQWGRTLAQYGSAVVKFVEKEGELVATVVPWSNLIVDSIDFNATPRIEKFYRTPAQLKNMATEGHPDYAGLNLEQVNEVIEFTQTRNNLDGEQKDDLSRFIELYEVHGQLPLSLLTGKETDEDEYRQQMHILAYSQKSTSQSGKAEYNDFTLYSGREAKDPYMLTHLIEEQDRLLSIGAVESLFDSQWMVNHTMKQWKDQMDLASRIIFQTSDARFVGKNVLTNLETGDIMIHKDNAPITQFPNIGHDITNLQAFAEQWRVLSQEVTSTPDATRGTTLPSGTPYSLGAYLGTQALSLFEIMTENKGHALEDMLRTYIVPHLKKKMNTKDEVAAILEDRDIKKIDQMYVPRESIRRYNQEVKEQLLQGNVPSPYQADSFEGQVRNELAELGNTRFLSPGDVSWKEVVKDLEWDLDVGITNEQADKQVVFTTLASVLQTIATNPSVLQDPNARLLFNKILSHTNTVSPVELSALSAAPQQAPVPQGNPLEALTNNQG